MKQELLHNILERALSEEMGLVVTTNNPRQLSSHLLAFMRGKSRYAPLMITVPSTKETVIIVKRSVELQETEVEI